MRTKAISFDFDGVFIRDSDAVFKKDAWRTALAPYQGKYELFLEEGKKLYGNGKAGGRIDILRHVYNRLGVASDEVEERVLQAARQFDEYVQERILAAGLVPGAMEALEELSRTGIPIYLNSGTATAALALSAKNLGIAHYFKGMMGSTKSKLENLSRIAEEVGAIPSEILVVGDGDSDVSVAEEFGSRFIGVANRWNEWEEGERAFPVVQSLTEVLRFL